jgi:4-hydroxy-3-polyprenylbenzoate decarboxylase
MHRLIVAITGASGAVFGVRTLQVLRERPDVETHLILTRGARATIGYELDLTVPEIQALADVVHPETNLGASISSGSFPTLGMIVAPCSIKALSGIANSYSDNLVIRAADVVLKERRRLVLLVRETPLHAGHLRLMQEATASGAIVMPPVPAFYHRPATIDALVDQTVGRALDLFGLGAGHVSRWDGHGAEPPSAEADEAVFVDSSMVPDLFL